MVQQEESSTLRDSNSAIPNRVLRVQESASQTERCTDFKTQWSRVLDERAAHANSIRFNSLFPRT